MNDLIEKNININEINIQSLNEKVFYEKLCNIIKRVRGERGVTQVHIAKELGISPYQYQKYENGINRFSIIYLTKVCSYLDINIQELIETSINLTLKNKEHKIISRNTTIVHNHYNGFFSNLFNLELGLMRNKIVLSTVITTVIIIIIFNVLKMFPEVNAQYNHAFLSTQLLAFGIAFAIIMFVVIGYSFLTYILAFLAYYGIFNTITRYIDVDFIPFNNMERLFWYTMAFIATFLTFYILKKCKVNIGKIDLDAKANKK